MPGKLCCSLQVPPRPQDTRQGCPYYTRHARYASDGRVVVGGSYIVGTPLAGVVGAGWSGTCGCPGGGVGWYFVV